MAKPVPATASRMVYRSAAVVLGTALATGGLAPAASAQAGAKTLALCFQQTHNAFATPVTNIPQPNTLTGTGTISCLDVQRTIVRTGTVHVVVTLPIAQCVGHETNDGSILNTITWRDGTMSTLNLSRDSGIQTGAFSTGSAHGTVTADSTRFPRAAVTATDRAVPHGCGTAEGATSSDAEVTLTFTDALPG